jgi:hypothetical protein
VIEAFLLRLGEAQTNRAVRSFGLVAAIGEVTTLLAVVLVLPSVLSSRRKTPAPARVERVA